MKDVIIRFGIFTLSVSALFAQAPRTQMAEEVFKNVQVLKGISVDEFMGTMGVFSAALGMSCENCHAANDAKWENYAIDTSPKKLMARRMVTMMANINKANFQGRQIVTCWTCHRGNDHPRVTPNFDTLYNAPEDDLEDVVRPVRNAPPAEGILDKYIQAIGGAQKANAITSIVAKGTSSGYGPEAAKRPFEIYAKPGQRTTIIRTDNGNNTTVFDGKAAWIAAPLRPVAVMELAGGDLDGVKLDAELAFPGRIKQALTQWKTGPVITIRDKDVRIVQGTGANGSIATLYFDTETGLLARVVRYANSVVGRMPTQLDYSDYRDVAGIKMPFQITMSWLDGRENVQLTDIQTNVAIDGARFTKPAPSQAPSAAR